MTQLPNLDFEAVRIFTSLIETLNLSNTAETCGVSISSASRTIAKLRAVFKDELFHRYPHGMRPTQRAKELEAPMRRLLRGYEEMLRSASDVFSPARESRMFRIGAVDQGVFCYLSHGLTNILRDAPNCGVNFLPLNADFTEELKSGELDLALYPYSERLEDFCTHVLCRDIFVFAVLADHPLAHRLAAGESVTMRDIGAYRKLGVSVTPRHHLRVDHFSVPQSHIQLRAADTAVWTPYFSLFPTLLGCTDLVAVMPLQLAHRFNQIGCELVVLGRPSDAKTFELVLVWHERTQGDPALQWLRSHFLAAIPPLPNPEDVPVLH